MGFLVAESPTFREMGRIQKMATIRQIQANRDNAKLSKGPVSEEGKAVSARNAFKHGLQSRELLLPDEAPEALEGLRESFWADLRPVGALEAMLVERVIGLAWRLRRLGRIETGVLAWHHVHALAERAGDKLHFMEKRADEAYRDFDMSTGSTGTFEEPPAKEEALPQAHSKEEEEFLKADGECLKARSELRKCQAQLDSDSALVGAGFVRDSREENSLSKLSRYETSLERNLLRTLHELQRLQAARQGKNVPVPVVVDVDVSGAEPRLVDDAVDSQSV